MTDQFHTQRTYIGTTAERGTVGATLGTDGVGILWRDTTLSSWFWWDGTAWDSMGPGGDPHPQYVMISPPDTARNIITAPTATIRPLAIQTTDDNITNPLTAWLASGGGVLTSVTATGHLGIGMAGAPAAIAEINAATATDIGLVIQTTDDNATKNLTEWQGSGGGRTTAVKADGSVQIVPGNLQIGAGGAPPIEYTAIKTLKTLTTASGGDKPLIQHTLIADTSGGNLAGNVEGILLNVVSQGNNNITGGLEGIRFFANATGNGTVAVLNALRLFARADSASGTVSALTGGNINIDARTGATVVDGKGINVLSTLTGTATITDLYSLYISTPTLGGTSNIVRHRGLYIEDINVADTFNYAIYTNAGDIVFNALGAANTVLVGGTTDLSSTLGITATAATDIGQVIRLAAAQSADAVQIQNSTPATLWLIEHDGGQVVQQAVVATGAPTPSLTITSAAHTTLTAGVERTEVNLNLSATQQWATGALALQRFVRVQAPTIAFVGASTIAKASTFYIGGAPIAGANATLTTTAALIVESGTVILNDAGAANTDFRVEGSGAPNALFVQGSDGYVGIGSDTPAAPLTLETEDAVSIFSATTINNAAAPAFLFRRARAGPAIVQDGDGTVLITGRGYDGAGYQNSAQIRMEIDGVPGVGDMPGRIIFRTAPDGTAALADRMSITEAGDVGIGTVAPIALFEIEQPVGTGAQLPSFIVTSAAHTTLTASVERHEVDFNFSATQQWATGPTATQRTFRVRPQTIAAVGASVFSNVSTIYVDGPPIAGANVTLTNTSALIIASGSTILGEATKQTNAGSLQLSSYWTFAEDAGDPTADVDYGKMWTKSDNNLYFQDGDGVTHIIHGAPTFLSETVTTQGLGANPDIFAFGFYEYSVADANLTQAVLATFGGANVSHASHAFIVAGGAGVTDAGTVGLAVSGTSITDAGVRTAGDNEVLSADITTLNLDDYLETTKKWLGTVTFFLFIVGGLPTVYSLDINYGLAKYEDGMNIDFTISSIQATGLAGAADADFDVQLYHHDPSGTWVYNAAAFTPLNAAQLIASLVTDHSTDDRLANQDHFAWKHTGLSQVISGSTDEGFIILISSSANNAVEYCNLRVGVEF